MSFTLWTEVVERTLSVFIPIRADELTALMYSTFGIYCFLQAFTTFRVHPLKVFAIFPFQNKTFVLTILFTVESEDSQVEVVVSLDLWVEESIDNRDFFRTQNQAKVRIRSATQQPDVHIVDQRFPSERN